MPLVPNYESVNKSTYPHFKNPCVQPVAENKAEFVLVKYHFSICFSIPVFAETYKNIKKLESEILKRTRSGKPDAEEELYIE